MKTIFLLKHIDIDSIDSKYNFSFKSNICTNNTRKHNTTDLNDLNSNTNNDLFCYLDESKKKQKCIMTMKSLLGKPLPKQTSIHCHWCKHKFESCPIGCPIKFMNKPSKHFITDGIFCSFNCCLAFINDNNHNPLYDFSKNYLKLFHNKLYNIESFVKPAPDWRHLNTFGGDLTIKDFRNTFNTIIYKNIDNYITSLPTQLPISWLYNENIYL